MLRWIWANRTLLLPAWVMTSVLGCGLLVRLVLAPIFGAYEIGALALLASLPIAAYLWRIRKPWRRRWALLQWVNALAWIVAVRLDVNMIILAWWFLGSTTALTLTRIMNAPLGERVTMEGELRDWPERGKRIGYGATRWNNTKLTANGGWTARLEWDPGTYDRDAVRKDAHKFEGARDLPAGSLKLMTRGRLRNSLDALFIPATPHAKQMPWQGPAKTEGYSAADPVSLGRTDSEVEVKVRRYVPNEGEQRVLLGGAAGSGKSGWIHNFVGEDACRDDVVQLGMDLKGGVELAPWGAVFTWMIHNVTGAIEMCKALEAAIVYREDHMREVLKVRCWPVSAKLPAIHLTVDEIRKLLGSRQGRTAKEGQAILDTLIDLATQGRALGIGLLAAGQRLTLEAVGSSQFNSQFDIRIGLRMNESDSASYVFPDDVVRLQDIPKDRPGTGYVKEGDTLYPEPVQGWFWSDELIEEIAELRSGGGALLDLGTGDAMAEASPMFASVWSSIRAEITGIAAGDDEEAGDEVDGDEPGIDLEKAPAPQAFDADDVSLAEVIRNHRERAAAAGIAVPIPLRQRPPARLDDAAAMATVWTNLREAGRTGCRPIDLYTAATRSSSWLHNHMKRAIEDGRVVRTDQGTYALASAFEKADA